MTFTKIPKIKCYMCLENRTKGNTGILIAHDLPDFSPGTIYIGNFPPPQFNGFINVYIHLAKQKDKFQKYKRKVLCNSVIQFLGIY